MQLATFLWIYLLLTLGNVGHYQVAGPAGRDTAFTIIRLLPEVMISPLPGEIDESSGLMVWDDLLWTLNDSGGEEAIYGLDPQTGMIRKTIHIQNAKNRDWESLTQDGTNIYIGDFGNNWGRRRDLGIRIISKKDVGEGAKSTVQATLLNFSYPGQKSFAPALYRSAFDCEAMVAGGDSLYLFTKDWQTRKTFLYRLPAKPGVYSAELLDSFDVKGLVTGAAWDPQRHLLALSGYENFYPLVWLFYDFNGTDFFSGKAVQVTYPEFYRAQTEGIAFYGKDDLLVSSEQTKLEGAVYRFSVGEIISTGKR
ncbi:MAG: T9SS C-terminal target domain-containing protein [Chlorobi bacterium]|nr:T9SS C-terminal target domain-containing protein [Chlorobiota bacterium]